MNERMENLMYRAGLTAQGCWDSMDEYDKAAILRFAKSIVDTAAAEVQEYYRTDSCGWQLGNASDQIQQHFGIITQEIYNHA